MKRSMPPLAHRLSHFTESVIREMTRIAQETDAINLSQGFPDFDPPVELLFIAELAQEFDAYVVTDEVYEHIVYAPHVHTYMAGLPGMFERTLSCSSLSKTYSITGWRLGYVIASPEIIAGARKVLLRIRGKTFSSGKGNQ